MLSLSVVVSVCILRFVPRHIRQPLHERFPMVGRPAEAPRIDMHRRRAVDKDVVDDGVVVATADEGRAGHAMEEIALDPRRGKLIVEIHTHAALSLEAGDVVKMVVPDQVATAGPVFPAVYGARVVRLLAHVMDLVQLQHVVIAVERDGDVRRVMDEVVGGPVADAVDGCRCDTRGSSDNSGGCGCSPPPGGPASASRARRP